MKINKKTVIIATSILLIILIVWMVWSNLSLQVSTYTLTNEKIPSSFSGFKIAQVSDFHSAQIGSNNKKLIEKLKSQSPDIIVITGDLIDSGDTSTDIAINFVSQASQIAPCYYITGNHEAWIDQNIYTEFESKMIEVGVKVLHNEEIIIGRDGEKISLTGIDDPDFFHMYDLSVVASSFEGFRILLAHRPERFEEYCEAGYDLIFSGHAHGGQFRIPLIGGLFAPGQGLFPEYDSGLYTNNKTQMIVSRGVGNSIIPVRFNNRPEIIILELKP